MLKFIKMNLRGMIILSENKYGFYSLISLLISVSVAFFVLKFDNFFYLSYFYLISFVSLPLLHLIFSKVKNEGKVHFIYAIAYLNLCISSVYFGLELSIFEQLVLFISIYASSEILLKYGIISLLNKIGKPSILKKK